MYECHGNSPTYCALSAVSGDKILLHVVNMCDDVKSLLGGPCGQRRGVRWTARQKIGENDTRGGGGSIRSLFIIAAWRRQAPFMLGAAQNSNIMEPHHVGGIGPNPNSTRVCVSV